MAPIHQPVTREVRETPALAIPVEQRLAMVVLEPPVLVEDQGPATEDRELCSASTPMGTWSAEPSTAAS